jgi:hypothetical protein
MMVLGGMGLRFLPLPSEKGSRHMFFDPHNELLSIVYALLDFVL